MTVVPDCTVRGKGDVVLFLHGVGGDSASWRPQLEHFSRDGCAAAWDMPGYGGSRLEGDMSFAALSDALTMLLDARGWERVHLVGHSMGGMVAQEFAATHQDRLSSLVLSATSSAFGRADGAFQKQFVRDRLEPLDKGATMADLADELVNEMMGASPDPDGRNIAWRCMTGVPEATYRAAIACIVTFDRRDNLSRIAVPALAIAGEQDRNAPPAMMERMASRIAGCRYVCLPGLGHLANLEDPRAFNAALEDFLAAVRS